MSAYSVMGVRSFRTPRGGGFNATLLCDGAKVADVFDAGMGGCYSYAWRSDAARDAFVASLPEMVEAFSDESATSLMADAAVAALVDQAAFRKSILRQIKSRHMFVVGGELKSFRAGAPREAVDALISQNYPGAVRLYAMQPAEAFAAYAALSPSEAK